jgi:magnesium chelatase subunit ChlD-like protein
MSKAEQQVLFLIDSSGSMIKDQQIAYMKGLIQQTITHYKGKRLKYAAVALSQGEAQLLSPLSTNTDHLLQTITQLRSGGKTNIKAGFTQIAQLISNKADLYIFTDGKINAGGTLEEAVNYYKTNLKQLKTTVINNESGFVQLGLAEKLANAIGAKYIQHT